MFVEKNTCLEPLFGSTSQNNDGGSFEITFTSETVAVTGIRRPLDGGECVFLSTSRKQVWWSGGKRILLNPKDMMAGLIEEAFPEFHLIPHFLS
ncbi:unnamed protein product [Danaus chrysippus]|uniref:(African queen) hypothetical protein n=1 Tax=Danaus chrysippus TaxID=151541 RepID=A0A8J2QUH0_9NEOP|nr:unnamed protein product [Danaus chrysippus]